MPTEQPIRREGLLKAYATALELIREMYKMDTKSNLLLYVPNNHSYALTVSGMMIMKIINSSYSHYVDVEEGKKAFNNVVTMLRKASVEDNDLRGRVSKIISQLWGLHHSLNLRKESDPVIRLKSRRSASLLHDSLWMWREEFGGQRFIRPRQVGVDSSAGNDPVNQADTDDNRGMIIEILASPVPDLPLISNKNEKKFKGALRVIPTEAIRGTLYLPTISKEEHRHLKMRR